MRYAPGHKGPTSPGPKPRGSVGATRPTAPIGTKPKPTIPSFAMPDTKPPAPAPTGPMTPVRGGGMAPASVATMMKKTPMMKKGGSVSSASSRADGCATKGKTKGKII